MPPNVDPNMTLGKGTEELRSSIETWSIFTSFYSSWVDHSAYKKKKEKGTLNLGNQ